MSRFAPEQAALLPYKRTTARLLALLPDEFAHQQAMPGAMPPSRRIADVPPLVEVGDFSARVCHGRIGRRAFLQWGAALPGLGVLGALAPRRAGAQEPKARAVILLWLWGAPGHLDTWDPKPQAPTEYRGPLQPIATRTPGLQITELFPRLAQRSHLWSLVRSHKTFHNAHPNAGTWALTGAAEQEAQPNFGSIVARHHGYGELPPFILVGRGVARDVVRPMTGYGGGKWGSRYDPFLVQCTATGQVQVPALKLLPGLDVRRLETRRLLLRQFDRLRRQADRMARSPGYQRWDNAYRNAFELLTSRQAQQALDLSQEPEALRRQYGFTTFGQSLLLARRLAEAGVPYIQVNWSQYVEAMTPNCDFGWDTHIYNYELLPDYHGPVLDQALSALLDDMHARGLLEEVLVVAIGEFGRTPKLNPRASRDHWPHCYSSLWAGGGVQGGRVVGASDRRGEHPVTEPIPPAKVGCTIVDRLGVDSVARAQLQVFGNTRVIEELF